MRNIDSRGTPTSSGLFQHSPEETTEGKKVVGGNDELECPVRFLDPPDIESTAEEKESSRNNSIFKVSSTSSKYSMWEHYEKLVKDKEEGRTQKIILPSQDESARGVESNEPYINMVNPLPSETTYHPLENQRGDIPVMLMRGDGYQGDMVSPQKYTHGFHLNNGVICFYQNQRVGFDINKSFHVNVFRLRKIKARDARESGQIYVLGNIQYGAEITVVQCKNFNLKTLRNILTIISLITLDGLTQSEQEAFLRCFLSYLLKNIESYEVPRCKGLCKSLGGKYWPLERAGTRTFLEYLQEAKRL